MDRILQKYYEDREVMTSSQGWKDLMEDTQKILEATDSLEGVTSIEQLYFKRGELSIIKWLLSLKETSDQAFKELKNENT